MRPFSSRVQVEQYSAPQSENDRSQQRKIALMPGVGHVGYRAKSLLVCYALSHTFKNGFRLEPDV